jgi:predicted hydrolase (HD superfamily)
MSVTTSSKRSQSKTKNNLASSVHIFEDPRFKEYETIPIEKFKLDKEKAQRDYNQLQNDLINLKEEYIKTKQRAADRETELRSHINNLLIKYRTRDPQQNLENINALHQEIINNIKTLEAQSKEDIREKKKDMETRIKLRLVDSEINYNRELKTVIRCLDYNLLLTDEEIRVILAHGFGHCNDVEPLNNAEKSLYTVDELTGIIQAAARMRPMGITDMEIGSFMKKFKDKKFAAKCDREVIRQGCQMLGMEVKDVAAICIDAMKEHAEQLQIGPKE